MRRIIFTFFGMKSYKMLRPNGFQPKFFKHFWERIGYDMWHLVHTTFIMGYINASIAKTLIVLILKESNAQRLTNFRLINPCNIIFKVITKILVSCLRLFLNDLISPLSTIKYTEGLDINYLGFPFVKGRISRNVYNDIIDRVSKRITS